MRRNFCFMKLDFLQNGWLKITLQVDKFRIKNILNTPIYGYYVKTMISFIICQNCFF